MFLNIDISRADFNLASSGLTLETQRDYDDVATRKYLEGELSKIVGQIIHKTYAHCAHCKNVFIKKKSTQIYCPRCKK